MMIGSMVGDGMFGGAEFRASYDKRLTGLSSLLWGGAACDRK
jgi:hypothetical protein